MAATGCSRGSLWIACSQDALNTAWLKGKNVGAIWCCVKQGTRHHAHVVAAMAALGARRPELVQIDWSPCEGFTPSGESVIKQVDLLLKDGVSVAVFCADSKHNAPAAVMMYLMVGAGLSRTQAEAAVREHGCARVAEFQPQGALDAAEAYAKRQQLWKHDHDLTARASLSAAMLQSGQQCAKGWERDMRRTKSHPMRASRSLSPCKEGVPKLDHLMQEEQTGAFYSSESQVGGRGFRHYTGTQHGAALPMTPSLQDCFGVSAKVSPSAGAHQTSRSGAVERWWSWSAGRGVTAGVAGFTPTSSWRSAALGIGKSSKVLPDETTLLPRMGKVAPANESGDCAEDLFSLMEGWLVDAQPPIETEAADNGELAGTSNGLTAHVPRDEELPGSIPWRPSHYLAKDEPISETQVPLILNIFSPKPHVSCSGEYHLVEGQLPNGQPLWRKHGDGPRRWLYSSIDGVWTIGDKDERNLDFRSNNGFIAALKAHCGAMPHTEVRWGHATFGRGVSEDPQITVTVQSVAQAERTSKNSVKINALPYGSGFRSFRLGTVLPTVKASLERLSNLASLDTIQPKMAQERLRK